PPRAARQPILRRHHRYRRDGLGFRPPARPAPGGRPARLGAARPRIALAGALPRWGHGPYRWGQRARDSRAARRRPRPQRRPPRGDGALGRWAGGVPVRAGPPFWALRTG